MSHAICAGLEEGHCALCQTEIQTYLEELVCPHWFLKNGARGFHLKRLARVFQLYDLEGVLNYLKVVAEHEAGDDDQLPYKEYCRADQRVVVIEWRKRRWTFHQAAKGQGDYAANEFTVSSFYRGQMIEQGRIHLGPGFGEVRYTPLIDALLPAERVWERARQDLIGAAST